MSPIQQMLLGVGAVATKTYVDDVFSTNVYTGAGSGQVINNGIDNSSEGGMVWFKRRDGTYDHQIVDTIRGGNKGIRPNLNSAQITTTYISSFNNNGYTLGTENAASQSGLSFAAWNFRKAPGFFTIKQYTGSGSTQSISHDLGSVPGMIIVKRTDYVASWAVYHRQANGGVDPEDYTAELNTTGSFYNDTMWGDTKPTSTHFTVGDAKGETNASGGTYIAYIFAGGESTAATARSVYFDGSDDYLKSAASSNYDFGSGDFTVEGWFKISNNIGWISYGGIVNVWQYGNSRKMWSIQLADEGGPLTFQLSADGSTSTTVASGGNIYKGQWYHFAAVRNGNNCKLFVNGTQVGSTGTFSGSIYSNTTDALNIGSIGNQTVLTPNAYISNIRVTKGQALYTSSFKVTTEPLTTTSQGAIASNVKLLCCNNSSVTGSTVTSGTITTNSSPTTSTDSPFDDPAGFVFGDSGTENVIKCGSYVGNGSSVDAEVYLGFEPQWLLVKDATASGAWFILDSMRGIVTGGSDSYLFANLNSAESNNPLLSLTPTGFKSRIGSSGNDYIFTAIRRSDGYCGKPPELGTGVFTPIFNATDSAEPFYRAANHVVDFALAKRYDAIENWWSSSRLIQGKYLQTNTTSAEQSNSYQKFDFSSGYNSYDGTGAGNNIGYLWKRHAGFDVQCYEGQTGVQTRSHGLNSVPEMILVKVRNQSYDWCVGHIGLNGGTNPWTTKHLRLNNSNAEYSENQFSIAPTSTHWSTRSGGLVNDNGEEYIAMLFASVDGISKVGYYAGNGLNQSVTTGFQPRFILIRSSSNSDNWWLFDSLRGLASSSADPRLLINTSAAQQTSGSYFDISSTGFTVASSFNNNNWDYVYYAHA